MIYTCIISVSAMRKEPAEDSEMLSQLLYGEKVELIERKTNFFLVKSLYDQQTAWVNSLHLSSEIFVENEGFVLVDYFKNQTTKYGNLLLSVGSESEMHTTRTPDFISYLKGFLNVPFLKGGKSFFGLDAPAFVQLVYKTQGIALKRFANDQAQEGEILDFINESRLGDLAFFENENGEIHHVGIMLSDSEIIHCYEKVRIDSIDGFGIFDQKNQVYLQKLRFIKRLNFAPCT